MISTFAEPATMLTDYGLGALCALFGRRLWTAGQAPMRTRVRCWAGGMGSLAAASFAGGTVHGWSLMLAVPVLSALWKGTALIAAPFRRWLMVVPCLHFMGYVVWMSRHDDFRYVIYNYGATFAVILSIQLYSGLARKTPAAGWIIAGVSVSGLAALVQQSGIALHPSFNYNDLYHVIQMTGVALLYRGAALLQDH